GLTVACARCHDHKFDPIPTGDYYSLYGIFRNCAERQVLAAKSIGSGPEAEAFAKSLQERLKKLDDGLAAQREAAAGRARTRVADYLLAQLELQNYPEEGFDQIIATDDLVPATVRRWRDYLASGRAAGDPVFAAWYAFDRLPAAEFSSHAGRVCRE